MYSSINSSKTPPILYSPLQIKTSFNPTKSQSVSSNKVDSFHRDIYFSGKKEQDRVRELIDSGLKSDVLDINHLLDYVNGMINLDNKSRSLLNKSKNLTEDSLLGMTFRNNQSLLHRAVELKSQPLASDIIKHKKGGKLLNKTNDSEQTPLHLSANSGLLSATQILLRRPGIQVNQQDREGHTALHLLTLSLLRPSQNHENLAHLEQKPGIDFNVIELNLREQLEQTVTFSRLQQSMSNVDKDRLLRLTEKLETLKTLNDHSSVDPNVQDQSGNTVLHLVASQNIANNPELETITSLLLDTLLSNPNLKLDIKDPEGDTPLHIAIKRVRLDIIEKLLEHPDISKALVVPNAQGETPLQMLQNVETEAQSNPDAEFRRRFTDALARLQELTTEANNQAEPQPSQFLQPPHGSTSGSSRHRRSNTGTSLSAASATVLRLRTLGRSVTSFLSNKSNQES